MPVILLLLALVSIPVHALEGFIGLTVGAGSEYATDGIVEAEIEAHCTELFPGDPDQCDNIPPELADPATYNVPPTIPKPDVGLLASQDALPEGDDLTPEAVSDAVEQVKASLGLPPDAPVTASVYSSIDEINAINSASQNSQQLCSSLVKLSIGNQGNCADYLQAVQGGDLSVVELRNAVRTADALKLLSSSVIDNLIRSSLGVSVAPDLILQACTEAGLAPFEPANSMACAAIYLFSQGVYTADLLLELPCVGEINYPELLEEWFAEQMAAGGVPNYDAICRYVLTSQRPDRVPPELVVNAVDVTVFGNDLPGRPLVRIEAIDARSKVDLQLTQNDYLELVTDAEGQASLVVRQPARTMGEKIFLSLGASDQAGNTTSLDIGLSLNLGERPSTGLEDYPELTFQHWAGAIGAQALPNLFLQQGWDAQFVGPQGSALPTSLRPRRASLAWTGAPEDTEIWIQVTNDQDQVADTLPVTLEVETEATQTHVHGVQIPLEGVGLTELGWQDHCTARGYTSKGNNYSVPFIASNQLESFLAYLQPASVAQLPDAAALTPSGEQCLIGPVSDVATLGALTANDQIALKVGEQVRIVPAPQFPGFHTHLAIDGCEAPRVKLAAVACLLDRANPWR